MAESAVLTLRLDIKLNQQLDRLSKATSRSRFYVAAQAIREYVALDQWQIGEINKALDEVERGEFAAPNAVVRSLNRWTRRAH